MNQIDNLQHLFIRLLGRKVDFSSAISNWYFRFMQVVPADDMPVI